MIRWLLSLILRRGTKYLVTYEKQIGEDTWIFVKKKVRARTHSEARAKVRRGYSTVNIKNIEVMEIRKKR